MTLTDRQAADMRASRAIAEVLSHTPGLLRTRADQPGWTFRGALTDAVNKVTAQLVKIYARLEDAGEPSMRAELIATIQNRVVALISSSIATQRGSHSATAARLAARLNASYRSAIPGAFDLAVHAEWERRKIAAAGQRATIVNNYHAQQVGAQGPCANSIGTVFVSQVDGNAPQADGQIATLGAGEERR